MDFLGKALATMPTGSAIMISPVNTVAVAISLPTTVTGMTVAVANGAQRRNCPPQRAFGKERKAPRV
jgi:hypothetical protein